MKKFLQFSIGISLMISACALFMFSVHPAYGDNDRDAKVAVDSSDLNILYVNIDTINLTYKAYTDLADSANQKLNTKVAAYQLLAQNMETRYAKLQERVNMGTISVDDAAAEESAINAGMDVLRKLEAEITLLEADAMAKNDSISALIAVYFKNYSEKHRVDYVLMYGSGMPIIYANPEHDVTKQVVAELNAEYDKVNQQTDRFGKPKKK